MVRSSALAAGVSCNAGSATGAVTVEGLAIDLNYCYPQAVQGSNGIVGAANINAVTDGLSLSGGGTSGGSVLTITITGADTPAQCAVTYQSPASQQRPVITEVSTGC